MRQCIRCNCQMLEGFAVGEYGSGQLTSIKKSHKLFAKSVGLLSAAICPNCGEVSMYLDNIDELREENGWDEIVEGTKERDERNGTRLRW